MDVEIDTKQIAQVQPEVQSIYKSVFPQGDTSFLAAAFEWAHACFLGNYKDYQPIDARYHDLEHTLQGTLCMARLLRGWSLAKAQPVLTERLFELGIIAILLHDTGYLKKRDDLEGTGAKYTLIHVDRSIEFAAELLADKNCAPTEIKSVQNMIRCTGLNVDLSSIPFDSELERRVGFALGTADLLGQMAARDYVEKLPVLYSEFAEAARFNPGKMPTAELFGGPEELIQKTPLFWEKYVRAKIENQFQGVYRFLNDPYPGGKNCYINRIDQNISRLRCQLEKAA